MRLAIVVTALVIGLAGCASAEGETPAWFSEAQAEAEGGYPNLREVPRGTDATTDAAHWAAVQAEMIAAGQAVKNHPRAQPAAPGSENPSEFLDEAREDLEETRQSHEPN